MADLIGLLKGVDRAAGARRVEKREPDRVKDLVDTNTCIRLLNASGAARLVSRWRGQRAQARSGL